MKITELVSLIEARRNPQLNPRQPKGHNAALQWLEQYDDIDKRSDLDKIGITMTSLPKLGVNPRSRYNTPLGIYFYPAKYYLDLKHKTWNLDFQDDAPYIQIIKLPEPILDISRVDEYQYDEWIHKLTRENAYKLARICGFDSVDTYRQYVFTLDRRSGESRIDSPGGRLWFITWKLANEKLQNLPGSESAKSSSVLWNTIWRTLGIATIVDYGDKIIHENEPTQGVVLETNKVELLTRISNYKISSKGASELEGDWKSGLLSSVDYISELIKRRDTVHMMRFARFSRRRIPRFEYYLLKYGKTGEIVEYARDHFEERGWPEAETKIAEGSLMDLLEYTMFTRRILPGTEHRIFQYPANAYAIAKRLNMKLPDWAIANLIKKDLHYAYQYYDHVEKPGNPDIPPFKEWVENYAYK